MLPDATIIVCRRSPIDTALSIHCTHCDQHVDLPSGGDALVAERFFVPTGGQVA